MPFQATEAAKRSWPPEALPGLFGRKKVPVSEIDESLLIGS